MINWRFYFNGTTSPTGNVEVSLTVNNAVHSKASLTGLGGVGQLSGQSFLVVTSAPASVHLKNSTSGDVIMIKEAVQGGLLVFA